MMNDNNHKELGISCEGRGLKPPVPNNTRKQNSFLPVLEQPDTATSTMHRVTSLTENQKYALTSLLIDPSRKKHDNPRKLTKAILLSTPYYPATYKEELKWDTRGLGDSHSTTSSKRKAPQSRHRNSKHHVGLWRAHENGLLRKVLEKGSSLFGKGGTTLPIPAVVPPSSSAPFPPQADSGTQTNSTDDTNQDQQSNSSMVSSASELQSSADARTDMSQCEVRPERDNGSLSSASTWDDAPTEHFDAWQVMNDEYAEEFGFNYEPDVESLDEEHRQTFQIIGTAADDLTAQPHVLSPPVMESLMNFVPDALSAENWWLKYSLVRDGASLETMQNYTRAAQYTVIAIQTTKGDVFGSFNTAPWQVKPNYFGSGESFVWKMRNNRLKPCSCLYEQAHMESEVDVYPSSRMNSCYQLCTNDFLAVGSGEIDAERMQSDEFSEQIFSNTQKLELGFAFALHNDLQQGTSSPSGTYLNPKLTSRREGIFEVCNLEVWTFTPCTVVDDAEQLEMKKHFLYEKMMNSSTMSSLGSCESPASPRSSQRVFYRRLGDNDEDEFQRDRWIMANMKADNSISGRSPNSF